MFRYTNSLDEPVQRPKSPRARPQNPKPLKASERPVSGSCRVPNTTKQAVPPQNDKAISERYTNSTYNRLPSPKGRFQALASPTRDNRQPLAAGRPNTAEQRQNKLCGKSCDRPKSPSNRPKPAPQANTSTVKESYSDIINRRRTLEIECQQNNIRGEASERVRPKTSQAAKAESHIEETVLNKVKNVLSRAVMQQGKIDGADIENIINSMRSSLHQEKDLDDGYLSDIDVESKPSRTTVNELSFPEDKSVDRKNKQVAGIVRKENLNTKPERKPYRKIYGQTDSVNKTSSRPTINKNVPEGDDETLLCVDLPDLAFPNFPTSKKNDRKHKESPNIEITVSNQNIQINTTKKNGFLQQYEVGDSQTKENHFWNSEKDEKLRTYIDSLIQNMKSQINCENSGVEMEGEIDSQGTVCRSFCVCKVCVSKKTDSLKESAEEQSVVEVVKPKLESTIGRVVKNEERKSPMKRVANNRLRLLKSPSKDVETNATCKVIRNTNPNFKPEASSLNTSVQLASLDKGKSFTVVDAVNNVEDGDDMYLQRRMRKAPSRRTSTKINNL